jgi:hypothetical protein
MTSQIERYAISENNANDGFGNELAALSHCFTVCNGPLPIMTFLASFALLSCKR